MPERTISRARCSGKEVEELEDVEEVREETATGGYGDVSFWISRITASGGRLRDLPRTWGIMQKEQRLLQPSWIFRMGRVWWDSQPWMGAERNSGWWKMLEIRIWAGKRKSAAESGTVPRWGATCCAPTGEWGGAAGATWVIRLGIWGLWELPTTWVTPGRVASSSGARWA